MWGTKTRKYLTTKWSLGNWDVTCLRIPKNFFLILKSQGPQQFLLDNNKNAPPQRGYPKKPESGALAGAGKTSPKYTATHKMEAPTVSVPAPPCGSGWLLAESPWQWGWPTADPSFSGFVFNINMGETATSTEIDKAVWLNFTEVPELSHQSHSVVLL